MPKFKWNFLKNFNEEQLRALVNVTIGQLTREATFQISMQDYQLKLIISLIISGNSAKHKKNNLEAIGHLKDMGMESLLETAVIKFFDKPIDLINFLNSNFGPESTNLTSGFQPYLLSVVARSIAGDDANKIVVAVDKIMKSSNFSKQFQALKKIYS